VAKISATALAEVQRALDCDRELVEQHPRLAPTTQQTYLLRATNVVRWLDDEFERGATLQS
jgi:hypothetical protein